MNIILKRTNIISLITMILKSDRKNVVQKYFLQYIHHFIQFKLHEKQKKKKKRYIYYIFQNYHNKRIELNILF